MTLDLHVPRGWVIVVCLSILCLLGYFALKHPSCSGLKYKDYVSLLASLGSLFVALVFILEYLHIHQPEKHTAQPTFGTDTQDFWYEMEQSIGSDPTLMHLYQQLHSNHPNINDTNKREVQEISVLLMRLENSILQRGGVKQMIRLMDKCPRRSQQIRVWRRWFQSPCVLYHYQFLCENLGQDTRDFIDQYILQTKQIIPTRTLTSQMTTL